MRLRHRAGRPAFGLCVLAFFFLISLIGCSRTPPPRLGVEGLTPWQVPEAAYGTQRIFRGNYQGPAGNGGIRLILRLVSAQRFQVRAVDALGRRLWSLDANGEEALWLNHRQKEYCLLQDRLDLADAPLGALPLSSMPAMLLGRLPEIPAGEVEFEGDMVFFGGPEGRAWRARLEVGEVRSWTLSRDGEPEAWYRFEDGESLLSDRARRIELRWREVVAEELGGGVEEMVPPERYRLQSCRDLELPIEGENEGDADGEPP